MNFENPILQRIAQEIEAKVRPEQKKEYLAAVVSGMKVMFAPQTHRLLLDRLQGDLIKNVATGISRLMGIIYNESQRKLSIPVALQAAIVLMCYALDFAEKALGETISQEQAAQAAQATTAAVLKLFGISEDTVSKVKGMQDDPRKLEQVRAALGQMSNQQPGNQTLQ